ncbi:MAG: zinc ABC transporter substrate-binding protein [Muribaculaceae bacterium]|nr:zinc ABC transporter substrate-binding protein [Muribaculaceae bacterium]
MRITKIFNALLTIMALYACSRSDGSERTVVVGLEPERALLQEIVGDRYKVISILGTANNPETFEPDMKDMAAISRARAFMTLESMPFEEKMEKMAEEAGVPVFNISEGVERLHGTHSHAHNAENEHSHGDGDPHIWTSFRNARLIAANMTEAMIKTDPEGEATYRSNFARLDARLDSLDRNAAARLKSAGNPAFLVWHPSLSYLARDYSLEQISAGTESKELSASARVDLVKKAKEKNVKVFFFQKEYDAAQARTLSQETGTAMVTISPTSFEWEEDLNTVINELCK